MVGLLQWYGMYGQVYVPECLKTGNLVAVARLWMGFIEVGGWGVVPVLKEWKR